MSSSLPDFLANFLSSLTAEQKSKLLDYLDEADSDDIVEDMTDCVDIGKK